MVNYYRDMWRQRSHLMAPLSALVSNKTKFVWKEEQQKAFDKIKKIITKETLLACLPGFQQRIPHPHGCKQRTVRCSNNAMKQTNHILQS